MTYNKDPHRYDDMLFLVRPKSSRRRKMSMLDRAAQFAPFAALSGHNDAILETERLTDEKIQLSEESMQKINAQILFIEEHLPKLFEISLTYFKKDDRKKGGKYITKIGCIKKIDPYNKQIEFSDKTKISIDDIFSIQSDLF